MDATSTATTTTRAQYRKRLFGYRVFNRRRNNGNNRGVVVMSDFYVSTYRTPTCNDHLEDEQSDDATCPYCEIEKWKRDRDHYWDQCERLLKALRYSLKKGHDVRVISMERKHRIEELEAALQDYAARYPLPDIAEDALEGDE
jgi:hypothetical protein